MAKCGASHRRCDLDTVAPFKICPRCREERREYIRARKTEPSFRELCREAGRRWIKTAKGRAAMERQNANNPLGVKARRAVQHGIRDGKLTRQPCSVCGASKAEAHHHNGYAREHWLDVVWLCRVHHFAAHGVKVVAAEA